MRCRRFFCVFFFFDFWKRGAGWGGKKSQGRRNVLFYTSCKLGIRTTSLCAHTLATSSFSAVCYHGNASVTNRNKCGWRTPENLEQLRMPLGRKRKWFNPSISYMAEKAVQLLLFFCFFFPLYTQRSVQIFIFIPVTSLPFLCYDKIIVVILWIGGKWNTYLLLSPLNLDPDCRAPRMMLSGNPRMCKGAFKSYANQGRDDQ